MPLLQIMLQAAEGSTVTVPTKYPTRVAYKLRESLHLIANNPRLFTEFSSLVDKYTIKTKRDCVELVPKKTLDFDNPIVELARNFKLLEVPEATDAMEVIGAIIKHKAPKFIFTGFRSSMMDTHLEQLQNWLNDSDYKIESENPLTIVKRDEAHSEKDDRASVP